MSQAKVSVALKSEIRTLFGIPRYLRDFHNSFGLWKFTDYTKFTHTFWKIIQEYCDQTTDCGGWTLFFRDWEHDKQCFCNLQNDHWLGNENISILIFLGLNPRGN